MSSKTKHILGTPVRITKIGERVIYKISGSKNKREEVVEYLLKEFPPDVYNTYTMYSSDVTEVWRDDIE